MLFSSNTNLHKGIFFHRDLDACHIFYNGALYLYRVLRIVSQSVTPANRCSCTAERRSLRSTTSYRNSAVNLYAISINVEIILMTLTSGANRGMLFVTAVNNLEWLECWTL